MSGRRRCKRSHLDRGLRALLAGDQHLERRYPVRMGPNRISPRGILVLLPCGFYLKSLVDYFQTAWTHKAISDTRAGSQLVSKRAVLSACRADPITPSRFPTIGVEPATNPYCCTQPHKRCAQCLSARSTPG